MRTKADSDDEVGGPPGTYVNAFARGLSVIRVFGRESAEMTLSEVAARAGLTRANARRILLTLEHLGYVARSGRRFRLTARILDLGYAYLSSQSLSFIAQPVMEDLASRVRERCNIAVLDGEDVIYIARVATKAENEAYPMVSIGRRFPAFATAMGRVLLGALPPPELERFLATARFPQLTAATTTDPETLRQLVLADRVRGWSYVRRELSDITVSVGVPLHDAAGNAIAALSIGWFPHSEPEDGRRRDEVLPAVLAAARQIDRAMQLGRYDASALR